jgi:hypothetical protein
MRRHIVGNFGDVNAPEHGGGALVAIHQKGKPRYYVVEHTDGIEVEHPKDKSYGAAKRKLKIHVWSRPIADDVIAELDWVDWGAVARSTGIQVDKLFGYARSDDPMRRGLVYQSVGSHYGWHELDQYPIELTFSEVWRRWYPGERMG